MFDILEGIVEHIMLFFNIPDRPFLTALVKGVVIAVGFFIAMRIGRFFFQSITLGYILGDAQVCIILGFCAALLSLLLNAMD